MLYACATDDCESVSDEYSVTQESNAPACGFLTGSIVVEVICFPEERPVPSPSPPLPHATDPPPPLHSGDPSNCSHCIQLRIEQDMPLQLLYVFISSTHALSVC